MSQLDEQAKKKRRHETIYPAIALICYFLLLAVFVAVMIHFKKPEGFRQVEKLGPNRIKVTQIGSRLSIIEYCREPETKNWHICPDGENVVIR